MFASLRAPGFAAFLASQTSSSLGLWVLRIAQDWLVVDLTHSPMAVGIVAALQFAPLIALAPLSGVIADRYSNRSILLVTQSVLCVLPAVIAVLVAVHRIEMVELYAFALLLGIVSTLDGPARQTFTNSIVGTGRLGNAVGLVSAAFSLAGLAGPLLAAWLLGQISGAWCFAVTSVGYLPNLYVVLRSSRVPPSASRPPTHIFRQLVDGIRYITTQRRLAVPMTLVGVIGMLVAVLPVVLIGFTTEVFRGDAAGYAELTATVSLGSFVGSSLSARRAESTVRQLFWRALTIGSLYMLASASPTRAVLIVALFAAGVMTLRFLVAALTMLQVNADAVMRGRVHSVYLLAQVAVSPVCAPVVGRIIQQFGARVGLFSCGLAATLAILLVALRNRPVDPATV
ncbi:MFS transporter [Dactylosporangium sp. CA-233914]|uniref:MFS transporter n=1 Tax=Dactylosporangium sp. CA-233914 TaxID=3239934 RepID=UPI003D944901